MMDEYAVQLASGKYRNIDEKFHFSCRAFAFHEIRDVLNEGLEEEMRIPFDQILVPEASHPSEYEERLRTLGVDCFLLASGAADGHVAFNGRGTSRNAHTRVTALAEETRRDNMHTFPDFKSLEEVPKFGVTVGPDSIARVSRRAIMLLQGEHKKTAFHQICSANNYDSEWPATIITECENPLIFADSTSAL